MNAISEILDNFRAFNRRRVYQRLLQKPCVSHPDGFLFSGRGRALQQGAHEAFEAALVKTLLNEVNLFVNIGAHHGFYTCLALSKNINTIAYEPEPLNIKMIEKHTKSNNFSTPFTLHPSAVGLEFGELTLFGGGSGGSLLKLDHSNAPLAQQQTVQVVTLDDTLDLKDSKALCLMDIEGFEYQALKGAIKILGGTSKPYWIIEVWQEHGEGKSNPSFSEVFSLMSSFGYTAWGINEHEKRIEPFSTELVKSIEAGRVTTKCGNFLFVHSDDDLVSRLDL